MALNKTSAVLAGDIGATKTNLGLFVKGIKRPLLRDMETYSSRDAKDLAGIITQFIAAHPADIAGACLGIAGPIINGRCKTTNLPWVVSEAQLQRRFRWPHVRLLNDAMAAAMAIPVLDRRELFPLNRARPQKGGTIALAAPGTGLGQALLINHGGRYWPMASEGGHVDFAPANDKEVGLWNYLRRRYGHVSAERVLSGAGLVNIYQWLKHSENYLEPPWLLEKMQTADPARTIAETALDKKDGLCIKALSMFVAIFGSFAGNLALTGMTTGGVYLGGGISPKILPKIGPQGFMRSFTNKGRYTDFLKKIPVRVILNDKAAVLGAAGYALKMAGIA